MKLTNSKMRSTAIAALLSLPLMGGSAFAQEQQSQDAEQQSQDTTAQQPAESSNEQAAGEQAASDQQTDALVATVGEAEIRGSDVTTVIGLMPPQLQSQPPQMLVPMALEQLILRELILAEARSQNLADDPDVVALVASAGQAAQEDAMVQVWLDREMANVVTDEAVQQVYEQAQSQSQQELPPIEQLRPQIEQHLLQQAMQGIQMRLREGADVVFYDPSGQPMEQQQGDATQQSGNGQDSGDAAGAEAAGNAGSGDAAASGDAASGDAAPADDSGSEGEESQGN